MLPVLICKATYLLCSVISRTKFSASTLTLRFEFIAYTTQRYLHYGKSGCTEQIARVRNPANSYQGVQHSLSSSTQMQDNSLMYHCTKLGFLHLSANNAYQPSSSATQASLQPPSRGFLLSMLRRSRLTYFSHGERYLLRSKKNPQVQSNTPNSPEQRTHPEQKQRPTQRTFKRGVPDTISFKATAHSICQMQQNRIFNKKLTTTKNNSNYPLRSNINPDLGS